MRPEAIQRKLDETNALHPFSSHSPTFGFSQSLFDKRLLGNKAQIKGFGRNANESSRNNKFKQWIPTLWLGLWSLEFCILFIL
jgi:hypothetical protein